MAIGWLTALKVVPWNDVLEAAPLVVSSARKFFSRTQQPVAAAGQDRAGAEAIDRPPSLVQLAARVDRIEATGLQLGEQQQASAALIQSLAEQNERLVQALDGLRKRYTVLEVACATFAVGAVVAALVYTTR